MSFNGIRKRIVLNILFLNFDSGAIKAWIPLYQSIKNSIFEAITPLWEKKTEKEILRRTATYQALQPYHYTTGSYKNSGRMPLKFKLLKYQNPILFKKKN